MANRYSFNIEWSEEDEEYIATCPAFLGLSAFGATEEEALKEGKIALTGFIQTYRANNMPLPEPITHEAVSGKFQLRLPKSLHKMAVRVAGLEGISLNSFISDAVRAKVTGEQVGLRVVGEIRRLLALTQTTAPSVITTASDRKTAVYEKTQTVIEEKMVRAVTASSSRRGN